MNALQQEIAAAVRAVIREELRAALAEEREPPPPYLTMGEAAKAMKVHPRTVRRWVDEGSIESRRIGSKLRQRQPFQIKPLVVSGIILAQETT